MSRRERRRAQRGHEPAKTKRERVLIQSRGCCQYCGCGLTLQTMTIDHVIPRSKGGSSHISNLVAACRDCNQAKGNDMYWRWKGAA